MVPASMLTRFCYSAAPPNRKFRMSQGKGYWRLEYRCACSDTASSLPEDVNLCGGAIGIDMRSTSLELSTLKHIHGEKIAVKVVHADSE